MKAVKAEYWQVWILNGREEWVLHFVSKNRDKAEKKFNHLKCGYVYCQLRSPVNNLEMSYGRK